MFRKRKDSEGMQGLNRISRLIEERQRENAGNPDDEAILDADDTIVLNRAAPEPADDPATGGLLGARATNPLRAAEETPTDEFPDVKMVPAPPQEPQGEPEPATAFAQSVYQPASWESPRRESSPREASEQTAPSFGAPVSTNYDMAVPSIGSAAFNGTLVAADAEWEGKLHAQGDVRIEGVLRGEIDTEGTLIIAPHAAVHGIARARDITLGGDIEGEVTCEQRLEILPGGSARGQINSGTLVVHEGAYIDSRFQMRRGEAGES